MPSLRRLDRSKYWTLVTGLSGVSIHAVCSIALWKLGIGSVNCPSRISSSGARIFGLSFSAAMSDFTFSSHASLTRSFLSEVKLPTLTCLPCSAVQRKPSNPSTPSDIPSFFSVTVKYIDNRIKSSEGISKLNSYQYFLLLVYIYILYIYSLLYSPTNVSLQMRQCERRRVKFHISDKASALAQQNAIFGYSVLILLPMV